MYRAGVIGCRGIGAAHATGIVGSDRASLVAACDLDEATLHEFEQRWPDAPLSLYRDHREMLARASLDIVTVATSDHRHADLVVDAANAGAKGIFCEKPLATNLADADRMIAACDANNTTLSVDHTRRFMPLWRHAKEAIVDRGVIGPVQYVVGVLSGPRAMPLPQRHPHARRYMLLRRRAASVGGGRARGRIRGLRRVPRRRRPRAGHRARGQRGTFTSLGGVRGFYIGGSKTTPSPKQQLEGGRHHRTSAPRQRQRYPYIAATSPNPLAPPTWPVEGIPAGIHELISAMDQGVESVSPGRAGHTVVELIIGFLESQRTGQRASAHPGAESLSWT